MGNVLTFLKADKPAEQVITNRKRKISEVGLEEQGQQLSMKRQMSSSSTSSSSFQADSGLWRQFRKLFWTPSLEEQDSDDKDEIASINRNNKTTMPENVDLYMDFVFLTDQKSRDWIANNKVMFILRGLSGSGKSTIVSKLVSTFPTSVVCSADNYFQNKLGDYEYQRDEIKLAHEECQRMANEACEVSTNTIIIDNTNVLKWEMHFYFNLANKNGYKVLLVEPRTPWKFDADILRLKNQHGVTRDVIARKIGQYQTVIPIYFAWFLNSYDSQSLLIVAKNWLSKCLDQCEKFREDFKTFSNLRHPNDYLRYFNREECLHSNQRIVHCTAKFCGREGGKDYASLPAVREGLGKLFDLNVVGFTITKQTFGARVRLSNAQLELWDNDEEKKTEPIKGKSARSKTTTKLSAKTRREMDFTELTNDENIEPELSCVDFNSDETEERFRAFSRTGSRAHITLGTSKDVKPVNTGFDSLQIVEMERKVFEGAAECGSFDVEGATLRKYCDGFWCIYPEKKYVMDSIFTGHYF